MSANVDVRVAEKNNVLSVPTSVIIGRGSKRSVYTVEAGVAKERKVEVGMANWERTEIVTGLKENEQVVSTLNVKGLQDGAMVQVGAGEQAP
jgi:HlyD family secretion protein